MKRQSTFLILISCLMLSACSHIQHYFPKLHHADQKVTKLGKKNYPRTNPYAVRLYNKKPNNGRQYVKIGRVKVSVTNKAGNKRQMAILWDLVKSRASEIGGHAVINLHKTHHYYQGDIIRYTLKKPLKQKHHH